MQKTFKTLRIIKDIFPFLWTKQEKIRRLFLTSFCLIFISIALDLSIPLVLKEVVSTLSSPDKSMTYQLSLLLVAYGVIWALSQTIDVYSRYIVSWRLSTSLDTAFCLDMLRSAFCIGRPEILNRPPAIKTTDTSYFYPERKV